MPRIRSIKPEFWSSLTIAKLSVHARLTFIGLWNYLDDHGRGIDDVRLVKAAIWPLDDYATTKRIAGWLKEIENVGRIQRYEEAGIHYMCVPTWTEHQRVDHPKASAYPPPDSRQIREVVATDSRSSREASPASYGRGEERKGEEGNAPAPVGTGGNGKYPVWLVEHPAVIAYWERFRPENAVSTPVQESIAKQVSNLRIWDSVLEYWQVNGYRPESVGKMLEAYRERVLKASPQARAVIPG